MGWHASMGTPAASCLCARAASTETAAGTPGSTMSASRSVSLPTKRIQRWEGTASQLPGLSSACPYSSVASVQMKLV